MSKTVQLITDLTELGKAIGVASKQHARIDAQWQVLAVSAIAAFAEHGNVFYVNSVYKALGKGARHKAMTEYLLSFGGVQANVGENKAEMPFIKDPAKKADMQGAQEHAWFDMATSPKPDQVIDYLALALKLVKRSPKDGQEMAHGELRNKLAEVIGQYADANGIEGVSLPTFGTEPDDDGEGDTTDTKLAGVAG